jgi:hypothetical protein
MSWREKDAFVAIAGRQLDAITIEVVSNVITQTNFPARKLARPSAHRSFSIEQTGAGRLAAR